MTVAVASAKIPHADWKNLPAELRHRRRQWVLGQLKDKIPLDPKKSPMAWASSTDPATWGTFEQCLAKIGPALGFGFVLTQQDCYTALDLDWKKGNDAGEAYRIPAWAAELLQILDAKYLEWSVSGKGVHALVVNDQTDLFGDGSGGGKRLWKDAQGVEHQIEIYTHDRYILLTGNVIRGLGKIVERTEQLANLVENTRPPTNSPNHSNRAGCGCDSGEKHTVNAELLQELLEGLGIHFPREREKVKTCCPFHDDRKPSFSAHKARGWKCFSGCGGGGAQALLKKIALLTDMELDQVAARTGTPRGQLGKLRERCVGGMCPHKPISYSGGSIERFTWTKYLEGMRRNQTVDDVNSCGYTLWLENDVQGYVRGVWIPCGNWDCPLCGPERRGELEEFLIEQLTQEEAQGGKSFHGLVPDSLWPALQKHLNRSKAKFQWFRTEHVGSREVIANTDFLEYVPVEYGGVTPLGAEALQPAVEGILQRLRRRAFARERLVGGSKAWHLARSSTRQKAEREAEPQGAEDDEGGVEVALREHVGQGEGKARKMVARAIHGPNLLVAEQIAEHMGLEVELLSTRQTWDGERHGNLKIYYGERRWELMRKLGFEPKEQSEDSFWADHDKREEFLTGVGAAG